MPIYHGKVKLADNVSEHLVDAPTAAAALKHLAKKHISVEIVKTADQMKDMVELAGKGVQVEKAEAE